MRDALTWIYNAVVSVSWLEVVKAFASLATAAVAFLALRNWRRQDKAKRETEFLDGLIEASHAYIVEMHKPAALLQMAKIGMASHIHGWEDGDEEDKVVRGAIMYIEKRGEQDGERLAATLSAVEPSVIRLRSLAAKGQVFDFRGYAKCQNAIALLTWHFDRLLSFTSIIESPSWNWENPEVRRLLTKVMAIEPDDIQKSIGENNVAVLEFARETYKEIYG